MIVLILLLVLLIAAGIGTYFIVNKNATDTNTADTAAGAAAGAVEDEEDAEDEEEAAKAAEAAAGAAGAAAAGAAGAAGAAAGETATTLAGLQEAIGTPPPVDPPVSDPDDPDAAASAASGVTQQQIATPPGSDPVIDCVGSFGSFSTCSVGCGGGTKSRTYTVTTPASGGGQACTRENGYVDTVPCNTDPCPVDCIGEWNVWSTCSQTCGGGLRKRSYNYSRPAEHGGQECKVDGELMANGYEESEGVIHPCPIHCAGTWNE
ncbi:hemicentin-like protein [Dishui Lake phycodnavirus 4]|nr:hemicentin-like protein [Dishui Lake phycodnavirus 4]